MEHDFQIDNRCSSQPSQFSVHNEPGVWIKAKWRSGYVSWDWTVYSVLNKLHILVFLSFSDSGVNYSKQEVNNDIVLLACCCFTLQRKICSVEFCWFTNP